MLEVKWRNEVVIVCGYGCILNEELKGYLNKVAKFLLKNRPAILIFSGGATQKKSAPGKTEADVMYSYITSGLGLDLNMIAERSGSVWIEVGGYTTHGNISGARDLLTKHQVGMCSKITIFCEAHRAPNVVMLARHFLSPFVNSNKDIVVKTASWELADPFRQVGNLIYNKIAITFPWLKLAQLERWRRVRRSRNK